MFRQITEVKENQQPLNQMLFIGVLLPLDQNTSEIQCLVSWWYIAGTLHSIFGAEQPKCWSWSQCTRMTCSLGGEDENLGSEIELGWKVCRESPNNWLPKSCLTSSFCWSTLVRCKACNNWYIRRFDQEPIQESIHCARRCLEKSNSRRHTKMAGSKIAASEFQWGVSLPQLLLPRNQQVIPQWLHLTAPLSLLTIIHCTLPTVIADNYLLHRPHKWLQL